MRFWNLFKWAVAAVLVILSFANASWLAPRPEGTLRLVAAKFEGSGCSSVEQTRRAIIAGGDAVLLDGDEKPGCPSPVEALMQLPRYDFIFRVTDGARMVAMLDQLPRKPDNRHGFIGDDKQVAAIRARKPDAWAFSIAQARKCFSDYTLLGWVTITPASCQNGTILIPLDSKWRVPGWPKRFQARMAAANTRVILTGPGAPDDAIPGLTALEQIPEIPRDYTGYAWIDEIELIGNAIRR